MMENSLQKKIETTYSMGINIKKTYTNRSKSIGKKEDFAGVFTNITNKVALPEEASIHIGKITAIEIALNEIYKKYVIYTDFQSSMHFIKYNKENHLILNHIYDIVAELQKQDKQIILCKIPAERIKRKVISKQS